MGTSSAETVREIENVRQRLEGELTELEERIPPAHAVKKVAAIALTGTTGTVTLWTVRRLRKRRKQRTAEKAAPSMAAVIKIVPDRWADQVSEMVADGTWKRPAAYAGAAWIVMKLAETRQLRKMNKLLGSRA